MYEDDKIAKYLTTMIIDNKVKYEDAIKSTKTSKEAIDWWIEEFNKTI